MAGYFSEFDIYGSGAPDWVEIALPAGTDPSGYTLVTYNPDGTVKQTLTLGTKVTTLAGDDIYVIDDTDGLVNVANDGAIALVNDVGGVEQFLSINGNTVTATNGPADGLTSTNVGNGQVASSMETTDGGATYQVQTNENPGTVPCYAPGSMIDTPAGPRAVETLKPGDLVMTLDHGPQPILWTRSGVQPLEDAENDARPIQIRAGALGRNLPVRDLVVSPQHRILVGGAGQLDDVFATEAFAPAKSLTAASGIRHMKGKSEILWIHFACERHEVVTANGCLSESLLLGPMVLNGLQAGERRALSNIFGPAPTPGMALNGVPARECLTVGAAQRQLSRSSKNKRHLIAKEIRKWDLDLQMERFEVERMQEHFPLTQSR